MLRNFASWLANHAELFTMRVDSSAWLASMRLFLIRVNLCCISNFPDQRVSPGRIGESVVMILSTAEFISVHTLFIVLCTHWTVSDSAISLCSISDTSRFVFVAKTPHKWHFAHSCNPSIHWCIVSYETNTPVIKINTVEWANIAKELYVSWSIEGCCFICIIRIAVYVRKRRNSQEAACTNSLHHICTILTLWNPFANETKIQT